MEKILTEKMMGYFTDLLCNTNRMTFKENEISNKLAHFAKTNDLKYYQDATKNVIIYKEGTGKYKGSDVPIILQAHVDMVCVSNSTEKTIDDIFETGVRIYYADKEKTKMMGKSAEYSKDTDSLEPTDIRTTLGADDGIGVAAICAVLSCKELAHPPLVAILTVEEEEGMGGASAIETKDITGIAPNLDFNKAKFINIDDERDGIFSVGCAGCLTAQITMPVAQYILPEVKCYNLYVFGLKGGHSGLEIDQNRVNANVLLCDILQNLTCEFKNLALVSFGKCGEVSNAIPKFASAVIAVLPKDAELFEQKAHLICKEFKSKYALNEPDIEVEISYDNKISNKKAYNTNTLHNILSIVQKIPNGVIKKQLENGEPYVETSNNIGLIEENINENGKKSIAITSLIRSSFEEQKENIFNKISDICKEHNAAIEILSSSPCWANKKDNVLRDLFLKKYQENFNTKAKAVVIHAGLECGYFIRKLGYIDMIACGPKITDVHTINETIHLETVPKFIKLLISVLEDSSEIL